MFRRRGEGSPRRKRYYNPGEVMRRKGCIGCGGMLLGVPLVLSMIGLAIALF
jgi:hypothetical protein